MILTHARRLQALTVLMVAALLGAGLAAPASAATYPAALAAPGALLPGQALQSPNGQYTLHMQTDGNLVLYDAAYQWLWHTNTAGTPVTQLAIQGDGNLVLYTGTGYVWNSGTYCNNGAGGVLQVQDDGNVVYYSANWTPIWHSFAATNIVKRGDNSLTNPYGPSTVTSGWTLRAQWVAARFREAFPAYTCNGQAPRTWGIATSDHRTGNGIDCSHRPGTDDKATGDAAAAWLRANAGPLKIKYVLWWVADHYDHIHISVL